ncbi:MAG: O-antigen ligase family protein [Epsilonproteobacteria bacterium]|nr:O-antigen ligase family protein [Campylobacterota bacterium]
MTLNKQLKDPQDLLNYLAIAYAFFLPISRAGIVLFSGLIIITWLFKPTIKDDIKYFLHHKFMIVFLLFLLLTTLGLLWSSNLEEGINYAKRYWYYLPMFILALNLYKDTIPKLISAFLISMLISEILSYGMYFNLLEINNSSTPFPTPFMHHIQYSLFIVFTALFLLNKIYYEQRFNYKIIYGLFFITVTFNIFINGGRTGYITFFITLFIVAFLNMQNRIKALLITSLIIFATLGTAYYASDTFQQRIHDSKEELAQIEQQKYHTSVGQRLVMYKMGAEIIKEYPILGTGTGEEMDVLKSHIDTYYPNWTMIKERRHFHNVFLHTGVQLGLLGLLLQLLIFYYLLTLKIEDHYFRNIKYIFVTIYMFGCFSGNMFHQQFTMALFALFAGILLAIHKEENRLA